MSSYVRMASILLGRCMETSRAFGVEVSVPVRELDQYLLMYFNERHKFYAHDQKDICKIGDIVLIKKLPEPLTRKITHEVVKVVYPIGNVIDPITGKKVVAEQYKDEMMATDKMFNRNEDGGYTNYVLQKRRGHRLPTNDDSATNLQRGT